MQIKKLIRKIEFNRNQKVNRNFNFTEYLPPIQEFGVLVFCLIVASVIYTYSTYGGLIWTSDSFHYWAASRSYIAEGVFLSHGGSSYVYWPPLFPFILSLFSENAYHIFQSLVLNTSLIIIYLYFKELKGPKTAVLSLLLFTISVFPYLVSSFLWSETIFILLLYSGLYFFDKWLKTESIKNLFLMVFCLTFMCLQRNSGLFMMLGITAYSCFLFIKNKNSKLLIKHAIAILTAVIPNIIWNLTRLKTKENYNILEQNYFDNIFGVLTEGLQQISKLVIPFSNEFIGILIGFLLMVISLIKLPRLLSFIVIIYFLAFSFFPSTHYGITDRFLAPIVPIFFLLLAQFALRFFYRKKLSYWFMVGFLSIVILYNTTRTYKNIKMWHERSIHHPKAAKIFF